MQCKKSLHRNGRKIGSTIKQRVELTLEFFLSGTVLHSYREYTVTFQKCNLLMTGAQKTGTLISALKYNRLQQTTELIVRRAAHGRRKEAEITIAKRSQLSLDCRPDGNCSCFPRTKWRAPFLESQRTFENRKEQTLRNGKYTRSESVRVTDAKRNHEPLNAYRRRTSQS